MSIVAEVEKLLLNAVNGSVPDDTADIPALQNEMYDYDVDLQNLTIQLKMLPNLLKSYNVKVSPTVKVVTSLRIMMNNVSSRK